MWELPLPAEFQTQPPQLGGCVFSAAGMAVRSPTRAKVLDVGKHAKGSYVVLQVGGRWLPMVLGLRTINVIKGQWVRSGDTLGTAGDKLLYRIGISKHPLLHSATPLTAAHPCIFHEEIWK